MGTILKAWLSVVNRLRAYTGADNYSLCSAYFIFQLSPMCYVNERMQLLPEKKYFLFYFYLSALLPSISQTLLPNISMFTDDTKLYNGIHTVQDCYLLQEDLIAFHTGPIFGK